MKAFLFYLLCLPLLLPAQSLTYERALSDGITRYEALDYEDAIKKFEAAKLLAKSTAKKTEISDWLDKAKDARLNALKYQLAVADSLRRVTDSALAVANLVLDQMYFYKGKFGLTLKSIRPEGYNPIYRYGFIDRNGNEVIPFEFEEATPFSTRDGFARVRIDGQKCLLDTAGKTYILAEGVEDLKAETEALDLHGTLPDRLPDNLGDFQNLKVILAYWDDPRVEEQLILYDHRQLIKSLPPSIGQLRKLHTLDLSNNQLISLPPEFVALENLKLLNLDGSHLSGLPEGFGQLQHLSYLNLRGSTFQTFPLEILQLTQLRSLFMGGLTRPNGNLFFAQEGSLVIPPAIGNLRNLQILDLYNTGISQLPVEIRHLTQLHTLNLGGNNLKQLPFEIGELKRLASLNLEQNRLTSLPTSVSALTSLSRLDLSWNDIQVLPAELHFSPAISNLNLRGNTRLDYPSLFQTLIHWPGKLRLTSSSYEWFFIEVYRGTGLLVSADAPMVKLPDMIAEMKNVEILEIKGYEIAHIPPLISELTQLRHLILHYNQLITLPEEIGQLTLLQRLDLSGNHLATLPKEIGQLSQLQELFLDSNPISPEEIQKIKALLPNCTIYHD